MDYFRAVKDGLIKYLVKSSFWRPKLNWLYSQLSYRKKQQFHARFAKLFENDSNSTSSIEDKFWIIQFLNSKITLPLRKDNLALDWDTALSVLGHDVEIKATYESLLTSSFKPECFIDVGASYGTHALLLAAAGVEVYALEPNELCHSTARKIWGLNGLKINLQSLALGERAGSGILYYPERHTWLGTFSPEVRDYWSKSLPLAFKTVSVIDMDSFVFTNGIKPDLIKIDAEGFDANILSGGINTLSQFMPVVIFESHPQLRTREFFNVLDRLDYLFFNLPFDINCKTEALNEESFFVSQDSNFITIPRNHQIFH